MMISPQMNLNNLVGSYLPSDRRAEQSDHHLAAAIGLRLQEHQGHDPTRTAFLQMHGENFVESDDLYILRVLTNL